MIAHFVVFLLLKELMNDQMNDNQDASMVLEVVHYHVDYLQPHHFVLKPH